MADNSNRTPGSGETIASDDVGGVKHQRVKISVGTDGTAEDARTPVFAGMATTGIPAVASMMAGDPSNTQYQLRAAYQDGFSGWLMPAAAAMLYNGATIDRQRGNTEGTLLASAARTTTTSSATQTSYNARGVIVFLAVTVGSGTGGLQVVIQGVAGGAGYNLNVAPTAITAAGLTAYEVYPGASGSAGGGGTLTQRTSGSLPRSWAVAVIHGDGSSYTYAVHYALIL